ncbi:MAG TPA: signal peptidase II [Baekduia sp.]|nr:signal peptidase II [Baekduia sp.]
MRAAVWARVGLVLTLVVLIDQVTKALVRHGIEVGEEDSILPAVTLVHVRNTGVAFGAFSGGGIVVVVLVAAALSALLYYFVTHIDKPLIWLPTGMLLGGSIGNIIDRVRDGAVTDFVKLPAWPAFNVADISITFGVLVLLWVIEQQGGTDATDRRPR